MQEGMVMLRWLPKYTFWLMFSMLTTSAVLPGYTCPGAGHSVSRVCLFLGVLMWKP
jgi:hypothetical protein